MSSPIHTPKALPSPSSMNKRLPSPPSFTAKSSRDKRSLSSILGLQSPSSKSEDGRSDTTSLSEVVDTSNPVTEKDKTGGKVKGFFSKIGEKNRTGSASSSSSDARPPSSNIFVDDENTPSTPPTTLYVPPSTDPLKLTIQPRPSSSLYQASSWDGTTMHWDSDEFRQAVLRAETTVDRLTTTQTVLNGVAAITELGAGWIPGVGKGVDLIVQMLMQAQKISIGRVAALRLVERSAAVLTAVAQSVIDNKGRVSPVMQKNINTLLANLNDSAYLMSKLADRSFLKLYLHADDTQRKINKATQDLQDVITIFQIQSQVSAAAWQEESRLDHQRDMEILIRKQEEARQDDQALLKLLEVKAEQQQEAIKTLQRTLDALLAYQAKDYPSEQSQAGRPESPTQLDSPINHPMPPLDAQRRMRASTRAADSVAVQTEAFSTYGATIPSPQVAERSATISTGDDLDKHKVFCERALDVLRRHSSASDVGVPDWTITSLEVSHGERISSGLFSVVYKGTWQNQDVAIKELNASANRELFIHEVDIWRQLRSPFILPFYGASSTTGPPPWFLISPYMRNKDILTYLANESGQHANKIALVHQMAQGMEYLHKREILHGDLKAANVLITDIGSAVICDFGLSHLKLDIVTRSQTGTADHALSGTMRWQSPERLSGGRLNRKSDVYAFAMTMYEVFTRQVPFGYVDDYALREAIKKGERPNRPQGISDALWNLMAHCWRQDSNKRPTFEEICAELAKMYHAPSEEERKHSHITTSSTTSGASSYTTASEGEVVGEQQVISPQSNRMPLPEADEGCSSSSGSIRSIPPHLEKELSFESDRAERHYRHYLQHSFDDRLTVPLWFPSTIALGSVGYIRHGQFVKLLDAHHPPLEMRDLPPMPYLDEFSSLQTSTTPVNVRTAAERGLDYVTSLTSFIRSSGETTKQAISRRVSFPLKPGMKQAALIVDDGEFEIYKSFTEARAYLVANIDWILNHFEDTHHINKEDVIIIVGSLKAQNYAMIVSSFAPRTTLTFNVHANPEQHKPWGTWSATRQLVGNEPTRAFKSSAGSIGSSSDTRARIGPANRPDVEERGPNYTAKVSSVSASPRDAVLLAKLKFPPGASEPALYP